MGNPSQREIAARVLALAFVGLSWQATMGRADVTVTDAPNFVVSITNAGTEAVAVDCSLAVVRVFVNGTPTHYSTPCALVTAMTVQASNGSGNMIDIGGVDEAFVQLGLVTVNGATGNDLILGSPKSDWINWFPGGGDDVIDGRGGYDTLNFNAANVSEIMSINANGSGFQIHRNVGSVDLEVSNVENVTLTAIGGTDLITVHDLTGVAALERITIAGGLGDDTIDASAQASPGVTLVIGGGEGNDLLLGGAPGSRGAGP